MSHTNSTFNPETDCTLATCSLDEYGYQKYLPNIAGNALYVGIFGVFLAIQLVQGIRYRTWGYLIGMIGGLILEVIGYIGRILMHDNIFTLKYFIMNIVCLTLGPAFFSASIYVCLSRIINIFGNSLSPVRPPIITVAFISGDIISIALQAAGGAISSSAKTDSDSDTGVNIMIAGLSMQVFTTVMFCLVCLYLMWKIRSNPFLLNANTADFRTKRSFKLFLFSIGIATVCILTRCCYRLAELSKGYKSDLANDQVIFMIFEGAVMVICVTALTVGHPGPILGDLWNMGKFDLRDLRAKRSKYDVETSAVDAQIKQTRSSSDNTLAQSERGITEGK